MPHPTISCRDCGFLQRKRDETWKRYGVETEQSRPRTNAYVFRIAFSILVALGFHAYMSRVIPDISG